ncbi:MAG: hypothetical protein KH322_06810 [Peptoniphilaceae bacterium]|nr:hypothetical protein [Peptoniphilaceae bacterium]
MERLGIAIKDNAGIYAAAALIRRRPDLSFTVLYDPAEEGDFYEKNKSRFRAMKLGPSLCLTQDSRGDFSALVEKASAKGRTLGYRHHDLNTEIIAHTIEDGLFHHSYVLEILEAYGERFEDDGGEAVLALLGYSYRRDDFARAFRPKGIAVVDPLDLWLDAIPETGEKGDCRFYWTVRDFPAERLMGELLGEEVRFRKYYSHPWLRGEASKKR